MAELNAQPIATKASHDPDFRAGDAFKASNPAILLRMLLITRVDATQGFVSLFHLRKAFFS